MNTEGTVIQFSKLPPSESIILKPKLPTKPNIEKTSWPIEKLKRDNDTSIEYVRTYSSSGLLPRRNITNQKSPEFILSSSLPTERNFSSHYATPSNVLANNFVSPVEKSHSNVKTIINKVAEEVTSASQGIYDIPTPQQQNNQKRRQYEDIKIPNQANRHLNEYDVPKNHGVKSTSEYAVPSPITSFSSDEPKIDHLNDLLGDLDRIYSQSKERRIREHYEVMNEQ